MSNAPEKLQCMEAYPPVGTPEDVASLLKMKPDAVRLLCRTGELKAIKCGSLWRIPRDWLADFINNGGTCQLASKGFIGR